MTERKEYRSALRSRKMIRNAFLELIDEKPFEKITVTDIVTRADLNRSTFYAHYPDIWGLVEDIQKDIFRANIKLLDEMDYHDFLADPKIYLASITNILQENIGLFKKLGHTQDLHVRLDDFRRIIVENIHNHKDVPMEYRQSSDFSIRVHFFVGGIMNTYQQWVEGKLLCSLDDITEEIANMVSEGAAEFLWCKL